MEIPYSVIIRTNIRPFVDSVVLKYYNNPNYREYIYKYSDNISIELKWPEIFYLIMLVKYYKPKLF